VDFGTVTPFENFLAKEWHTLEFGIFSSEQTNHAEHALGDRLSFGGRLALFPFFNVVLHG